MLLNPRWGVNAELTVTGFDLWYGTVYLDFVTNIDAHQILANLERPRIGFSSMRNHLRDVWWHDVRVDRELWFYARKTIPACSGVVWCSIICVLCCGESVLTNASGSITS